MKKIVLTCITNDYDKLKSPEVRIEGWEFHCFTDNSGICDDTIWQAHHYTGNDRDVKMLSHKFIDYDVCLWVDGSIGITNNLQWFDDFIANEPGIQLLICQHPSRSNAIAELKHCLNKGIGKADVLDAQLRDYQKQGQFMEGLYQMGVHLKVNKPAVNKLFGAWHEEYNKYPSRDQPSFTYVLNKTNFKPFKVLSLLRYRKQFTYFPVHNSGKFMIREHKPFVNWIQPFSSEKRYGYELNRAIERLPDDEWVGVLDQDVMWLQPGTKKIVEDCIRRYPDTQLFSGITNRLGLTYQLNENQISEVADVKFHAAIARERAEKFKDTCRLIHNPVAGFMMVFPKYVWEQNKFIDGITTEDDGTGIAFFDWIFSKGVMQKQGNIRLMLGVYIFHYYRFLEGGQLYTRHLYK